MPPTNAPKGPSTDSTPTSSPTVTKKLQNPFSLSLPPNDPPNASNPVSVDLVACETERVLLPVDDDAHHSLHSTSQSSAVPAAVAIAVKDSVCEDIQAKTGEYHNNVPGRQYPQNFSDPLSDFSQLSCTDALSEKDLKLEKSDGAGAKHVSIGTQTDSQQACGMYVPSFEAHSEVKSTAHQYKYSVEVHSIYNLGLSEGPKYYIK